MHKRLTDFIKNRILPPAPAFNPAEVFLDMMGSRYNSTSTAETRFAEEHVFAFERAHPLEGQDRYFILTDFQLAQVEAYAHNRAKLMAGKVELPQALLDAKDARSLAYQKRDKSYTPAA